MLWRMPADSYTTRIGIMSAFQHTDRRQYVAGIAGRGLFAPYSGAKELSARSRGGVAETSQTSRTSKTSQTSERMIRSVPRPPPLLAAAPTHVGPPWQAVL